MVTFDPDSLPLVGDEHTTRAGFLRRASAARSGSLLGGVALEGLLGGAEAEAATPRSPNDVRRFHSRPDLRPPRVTILRGGDVRRLLFLAPSSGPGQRGALILDGRGDVVWFHPTTPLTTMNFRPALYKGKPVLTCGRPSRTWARPRQARRHGLDVPSDRAAAGSRPTVRPARVRADDARHRPRHEPGQAGEPVSVGGPLAAR